MIQAGINCHSVSIIQMYVPTLLSALRYAYFGVSYINHIKLDVSPSSRNVSISASFPKSVLFYRSSDSSQRGLECNVDRANFSIRFSDVQLYISRLLIIYIIAGSLISRVNINTKTRKTLLSFCFVFLAVGEQGYVTGVRII